LFESLRKLRVERLRRGRRGPSSHLEIAMRIPPFQDGIPMVATLAFLAVVGTSTWTPGFPNPQGQDAPAEEPVSKVPS
jgi:hypothetical protein